MCSIEKTIKLSPENIGTGSGSLAGMIAVIASYAVLSYDQIIILIAYVSCWLYFILRYFSHYSDDLDLSEWVKMGGSTFAALICIYIFSRASIQRERD